MPDAPDVGPAPGADESLLLHPPAASASTTSAARAELREVVRDLVVDLVVDLVGRMWKGGKPRVLSGQFGGCRLGAVMASRMASGTS